MTTLATSFLIGSSLFLQVTKTTIKSLMGSEELAAPEGLKKIPIDLQCEKCCDHSRAFIFG